MHRILFDISLLLLLFNCQFLWIFYVIYFYAIKSSVVITRSNTTWYRIHYSSYGGRIFTGICIHNRHPYLTLTCELWGVYCSEFGENWPRYNGTALYSILLCWHCDNHMIVQVPVILKDISKRSQSKHYDVIKWNMFSVTGPLCAEFTGLRWIPHTKSRGAELWCFLLICAWINGWVNNREGGDLRRDRGNHDAIVMI